MSNRRWTVEEIEYLIESWGKLSVTTIAKKLNRTEKAIIEKKSKLKLGSFNANSGYISLNELLRYIYRNNSSSYIKKKMLSNGLPTIDKKRHKGSIKMVNIDVFWEWGEKHQNILNFRSLEENLFGQEPMWVKAKRKTDYENQLKYKSGEKWTEDEVARLKKYTELGFSLSKISEELCRSKHSIRRKRYDYYMV